MFVSLALPEYVKADLLSEFDATFNETGSLLSQDALIERALLRDGEAKVRRSAVFAASFRSLWILLSPLRQAVLSDTDDGVRGDIVTTLGRSPATPGVLDVLQAVATRDGSPDVRAAAARAISGRP